MSKRSHPRLPLVSLGWDGFNLLYFFCFFTINNCGTFFYKYLKKDNHQFVLVFFVVLKQKFWNYLSWLRIMNDSIKLFMITFSKIRYWIQYDLTNYLLMVIFQWVGCNIIFMLLLSFLFSFHLLQTNMAKTFSLKQNYHLLLKIIRSCIYYSAMVTGYEIFFSYFLLRFRCYLI